MKYYLILSHIYRITRDKEKTPGVQGFSKNKWCPVPESNQRHGDFQSPALPTELTGHVHLVESFKWWASRDLNPGPAGYEPDALTTELEAQSSVVGVAGFEPAAHWSQTSCATKLRYTPI